MQCLLFHGVAREVERMAILFKLILHLSTIYFTIYSRVNCGQKKIISSFGIVSQNNLKTNFFLKNTITVMPSVIFANLFK